MSDIEIPLADNNQPVIDNAKVQLIIERGEARNRVREVVGPLFLIGANEDADLVLGDNQFADYHAYVCVRGNEVTLRHLGNTPEVTVNGRIVRWGELRDGDRLRMGPYQFRLAITPVPEIADDAPAVPDTQTQPDVPAVDPTDNKKRWEAHAAAQVSPMSDAWTKATTAAQVVGWFDEVGPAE